MNRKKNLSPLEYMETLQKEYFINELRSKFYYSPADKTYYKKVCSYKKEKILSIANQNSLRCIFNDDLLFSEVKKSLYPNIGLPQFDMSEKDIENYYSLGSDVKCNIDNDEILLGKIIERRSDFKIILVKMRNTSNERQIPSKFVTRII